VLIDVAGAPVPYSDPWIASFHDRLAALGARERRVAYFYEQPEYGTFRYRVFNMVQALDADPALGVSAAWFTRQDLSQSMAFVDRADLLVICRTRYDDMIGRMIARARSRGLPVLYDVDDLIFDPDYAHAVGDIIGYDLRSSEAWDRWFANIARLGATLRLCDGAITTNEYLGKHIAAYAPWIAPRIVQNFLNDIQVSVSRPIYERKCAGGYKRDGRMHIGYLSGSHTHNKDFGIVSGALARLLDRDPRIVLRLVGLLDLPGEMARHADRIETYPIQDFANLQRLQGEIEICLAPVQDTVFTNCKSELKYFEAAITGSITIASPSFTFRRAIREGETGFLARAHEWEEKVGQLVALLDDDPSAYESLSHRAFAHADEVYGWDRQGETIVAALFGHGAQPPAGLSRDRAST
jgi:glycosyltransferase involved in cell wall biosynthesis